MPFITRLKCALWIVAVVVLGSASLARDGAFFDGTAVERARDLGVVPPIRGGLESHYRYLSLRAADPTKHHSSGTSPLHGTISVAAPAIVPRLIRMSGVPDSRRGHGDPRCTNKPREPPVA